jgi:hypothetical protein
MALSCPECGGVVPTENINIQETLALCDRCGHLFDFRNRPRPEKVKHRKVKQPRSVRVAEDDSALVIAHRRVFNLDDKKNLAWSAGLLFVLALCYLLAVSDYASPLTMAIIEALPAAAFLYLLLMLSVNTTRVTLTQESLTVEYRPLPPLPLLPTIAPISVTPKTLRREGIVRVYCEETSESRNTGTLDRYYHLCAQLIDGNRVILLHSLPQDHALYMARILDERLRIEVGARMTEPDEEFFDDYSPDNPEIAQLGNLLANDYSTSSERSD